jgi:hypothetical protein
VVKQKTRPSKSRYNSSIVITNSAGTEKGMRESKDYGFPVVNFVHRYNSRPALKAYDSGSDAKSLQRMLPKLQYQRKLSQFVLSGLAAEREPAKKPIKVEA